MYQNESSSFRGEMGQNQTNQLCVRAGIAIPATKTNGDTPPASLEVQRVYGVCPGRFQGLQGDRQPGNDEGGQPGS